MHPFRTYSLIFSTLILFRMTCAQAQTTISGQVSDTRGEHLVGANIYLEGTYDGASSNSRGIFQLETDESGAHVLCIDYIGYEPYKTELMLNGAAIQLPTVELKEAFNELTAVTIAAGTFEAGDKKKSIALTSIDMLTTAGSAGDVFGALQSLPGTTTVGESGKLFVKGGDSRESKTYIDGSLVYVPYSSSSPNSSVRGRFSPWMFSGTMFSTGGYSAEYGQALSSVLSLQTHAMPVQDQVNISLLSVGAELGGTKTWEKAALTSSIKYENLGPYMRLFPQNRNWEKEPLTMSGDLSFRLNTGKSGMLKFYANVNQSRLSTHEYNLNKPGSSYLYSLVNDNYYFNGSWIGEVAEDWILTITGSFTHNTDDMAIDSLPLSEKLHGTHVKTSIKHTLNERVKIMAGTELYAKNYGMEFPALDRPGSQSFHNRTLAGFLEGEIYTSSKFVSRVGVRAEYSDYLRKANVAPRLSTAYKWSEREQISLSYGWFYQDPDDRFLLYTPELSYERADHLTLNYIRKTDRRVLRTELYYKDYKKLIRYSPGGSNTYTQLNNSGYGNAWGLDLFWRDRKSIRDGEYWVSYSYLNALRNYHDYPLEAVPGFASKHNLTLVYKHWFSSLRSMAGATFRYSSPRYYNNPNSEYFNQERTLAYQSLDVNWSFLLRQHVICYFSVSNVLGFKQEFGQQYASLPNEEGVYHSAPILPGSTRFFILGCFITLSKNGDLNQLDKIN
jgi:hypothetical protein